MKTDRNEADELIKVHCTQSKWENEKKNATRLYGILCYKRSDAIQTKHEITHLFINRVY